MPASFELRCTLSFCPSRSEPKNMGIEPPDWTLIVTLQHPINLSSCKLSGMADKDFN